MIFTYNFKALLPFNLLFHFVFSKTVAKLAINLRGATASSQYYTKGNQWRALVASREEFCFDVLFIKIRGQYNDRYLMYQIPKLRFI